MTDTINANVPTAARRQVKEANRLFEESKNGPAPIVEPSAAAKPVVAPPAEDPVLVERHKYNVLAGKYNAETGRLMGAAQALKDENERLLARLAAHAAPAPAPAALKPEQTFAAAGVTAKEREEYGPELVDMMARIAASNSSAEVASLKAELAKMRGTVQQTVQISQENRNEKIWAQLDAAIHNWRVINESPEFVDWLGQVDILSGQSRKTGLTQAFDSGDGHRVVGIFKRFVEEDSASRSTPPPPVALVDKGTLIAPGSPRGSAGEAPNGSGKRMISEQEIDDFYSRVQRKRIGDEEKKVLEAEYQEAVRDGRVIPRRNDQHLSNSR